jgi:hypothetical protein
LKYGVTLESQRQRVSIIFFFLLDHTARFFQEAAADFGQVVDDVINLDQIED